MASQLAHLLLFISLAQLVTTVLCFSFPLTIISSSDQRHRCRLGGVSRSSDETSNDDDIISISIQKQFSDGVTPKQAKDAWMEYHWKKGGGLPILVLSSESSPANCKSLSRTRSLEARFERAEPNAFSAAFSANMFLPKLPGAFGSLHEGQDFNDGLAMHSSQIVWPLRH